MVVVGGGGVVIRKRHCVRIALGSGQKIAQIARIAQIDFRMSIVAMIGFRFFSRFGPKAAKIDQNLLRVFLAKFRPNNCKNCNF